MPTVTNLIGLGLPPEQAVQICDGVNSAVVNATAAGVAHIRALVMHKDAVATVKLMDLSVESEYQIQRQGTLIVSKYAMGHDVLRPAMAVALMAPNAAS